MSKSVSTLMSLVALLGFAGAALFAASSRDTERVAWGAMALAMLSLGWHYNNDARRES